MESSEHPLALRVCSQEYAMPMPLSTEMEMPLCSENAFPLPLCSHRHSAFVAAHALVSDALFRCSSHCEPTRVTVDFSRLEAMHLSPYPTFKLEVADTGRGMPATGLGDFYPYYLHPCFHTLAAGPATDNVFWDGVLAVMTTASGEEGIRCYQMHVQANLMPQVVQLPSVPKAVESMSGTQTSLTFRGQYEEFIKYIQDLCHKVSVLNIKNVFLELCFENFNHTPMLLKDVSDSFVCDGGLKLPDTLPSLQRLSSGLIDFLSKYIYQFQQEADEANFRSAIHVGEGRGCTGKGKSTIDVSFAVLEKDTNMSTVDSTDQGSVLTQVLFYEDFCYHHIPETVLTTLRKKVAWSHYGLKMQNMHIKPCGGATIKWERLARHAETYLVIHFYRTHDLGRRTKTRGEPVILKRAVESALGELHRDCPGLFVSHHIQQMQRFAPSLSRCVAGLIASSEDSVFKAECTALLGLTNPSDLKTLETCIQDKMLNLIDPYREVTGAPKEDDRVQILNWMRSVAGAALDSQFDTQPDVADMDMEE